eukprot:6688018-Pyramimonas_sp.AAC.1
MRREYDHYLAIPHDPVDKPPKQLQKAISTFLMKHRPRMAPDQLLLPRLRYWNKDATRADAALISLRLNVMANQLLSFLITALLKTNFNAWPTTRRFRQATGR